MFELLKVTLTGEVCPEPGAARARLRRGGGLGVLAAVLVLWACGAPPEEPAGAFAPEPEAMATAEAAQTCAPSELESGERRCAGSFTYSLECYALRATQACGQDTGTKSCTVYRSCQHPDFGKTRGPYSMSRQLDWDGSYTCDDIALAHLDTLSATDRQGVTYTYYVSTTGEWDEMLTGGADDGASAWAGLSVINQTCHINFSNYPVPVTGTGPQCGTSSYSCAPACVNYKLCRHPDFGTGATSTTVITQAVNADMEETCDSKAQQYLASLPAYRRTGATYTYTLQYQPAGLAFCTITFVTPDYQMGSGPQCGTQVGPCTATSVSPVYNECRHASHGEAPDAQCGAGYEAAQAPAGSTPTQTAALATSQWTAAKNLGAPVYDAPITCSDCRGALSLTREQVARRVYATAGMAKKDAKLHILAGSAYYLARDNPAMTQAELTAGLNSLASALGAYTVPAAQDGGTLARRVLRILSDAEPTLGATSPAGKALRTYTRELLAAMRLGLEQERRLAPLLEQVDRYPEAEAFISEAWGQLFDLAATRPALAAAVNDGGIGAALGVRTTDTFQVMLNVYPLEPLKTFILSHVDPEGGISTTPTELTDLAASASSRGLQAANAYAASVLALNDAQDDYVAAKAAANPVGPTSTSTPSPADDAFKAAIAAAKTRQESLASTWKDTKEAVSGATGLAVDLVGKDTRGGKDLALLGKAVEQTLEALEKYSASSLKIAEKIVGTLELGASALDIVSSAIFTGQMVGAVLKVLSLFSGKTPEQSLDEKILIQVRALRDLVVNVQREMRGRFDRTDRNITRVYDEMLRQFAIVNWQLGTISEDVNQLQKALYGFQGDINRLDRNVYAYLAATSRRSFVEEVNDKLEWRVKVPNPDPNDPNMQFTFADYEDGENLFQTWAVFHSKDALAAGPEVRGYTDANLLTELGNYPLAFNINYLRILPGERLTLPVLYGDRVANPLDWVAGAEAWLQLSEEWPDYARYIGAQRRTQIIQEGENLKTALRRIEQAPLFDRLAAHYDARWENVKTAIANAEHAFETHPLNKTYGVDLWSGPDQRPSEHWLAPPSDHALRRCQGYEYRPGIIELPLNLKRWPHEELKALMLAHNLGLGTLSACVSGDWDIKSYNITELGTFYVWRLYAEVQIRYNGTPVYVHKFTSTVERSKLVRPYESSFNPATYYDTYGLISDNWAVMAGADSTRRYTGATVLTQVRPQVSSALTNLQRGFYLDIASRLTQAGDPVGAAAQNLSGSKLLWESYVAMGLPLSLTNDEALRELLYGQDKVMTGVDLQGENTLPDDVQDVYTLFGNAASPPARNIMTDLDASVRTRSQHLKTTVGTILARLQSTGDSEADSWVDTTLLRLRVTTPTP